MSLGDLDSTGDASLNFGETMGLGLAHFVWYTLLYGSILASYADSSLHGDCASHMAARGIK